MPLLVQQFLCVIGSSIATRPAKVSHTTPTSQTLCPWSVHARTQLPPTCCTSTCPGMLRIGACASLTDLSHVCERLAHGEALGAGSAAGAIRDMLRWFASSQIRNVACVGALPRIELGTSISLMKRPHFIKDSGPEFDTR